MTHNEIIRDRLLWNVIRASPILYPLIFLFNILIEKNNLYLYLFVTYIINLVFNGFLKVIIFKPLYNLLNVDSLPIIGIGRRPKNAIYCSNFITINNNKALSFGMPSGHSQCAWFVTTFLILLIWDDNDTNTTNNANDNNSDNDNDSDNDKNKHNKYNKYLNHIRNIGNIGNIDDNTKKYIISAVLIGVSTLISYSRVYVEGCHTIQQVIIGGLIGIITGYISHHYYKKLLKY